MKSIYSPFAILLILITVFTVDCCKPSKSYHAMSKSGYIYKSGITTFKKSSKYYVVISYKKGTDMNSVKIRPIVVKWRDGSGAPETVRPSELSMFECSWGPPKIGPREDIAFQLPSNITGGNIEIEIHGIDNTSNQLVDINILETSL